MDGTIPGFSDWSIKVPGHMLKWVLEIFRKKSANEHSYLLTAFPDNVMINTC